MEQLDAQEKELMDAEESIFQLSNRTFQHANQANDGFGKNLNQRNKAFQQESKTYTKRSFSIKLAINPHVSKKSSNVVVHEIICSMATCE